MKRLGVFVLGCAVSIALGCAGSGQKTGWDEAMKDFNGDNMKMQNDYSGAKKLDNKPLQFSSATDR